MAKRITSALLHFSLFTIPFLSSAAIPVRWTVDTFRVKPLVYDCYHGETLDLAAAMTAYGDPLDLHGKTARLYWQTNGMDAAYWSTNANVSSVSSVTNVLSATFVGSFDPGAPSVSGFIGVEGENYRAAFTLNFRPSPGFTPAHISPPVKVLDFATTTVANPDASPFMVKGGSGGVTAQQATNIASAVVAPISSTQSVHSATLSSHTSQLSQLSQSIASRTTTNDVNAIIASSNLCTVAALQAETQRATAAEATKANIVDDEGTIMRMTDSGEVNTSFYKAAKFISGIYATSDIKIDEEGINIDKDPSKYPNLWQFYKVGGSGAQTLPDYLASTAWHGSNKSLSDYGITNVAASVDYSAVTSIVESASVTNGGAKAYAEYVGETTLASATNSAKSYADAKFLKGTKEGPFTTYFTTTEVPVFVNGISFNSQMQIYKKDDRYEPYFIDDIFVFKGSDSGQGSKLSELKVDGSDVMTQNVGDNRYLRSYTETDPTATAKAQAAIASTLSGRTYDFANGVNFTKNLYTALTNVIQTLGGTVTNPPTFN